MTRTSTAAANDSGAIDDLWAVAPESFVAARDALAAELRKAGDVERARAVKALKRPTPSAWVVNALVRRAHAEIEAVFDAGDELISAQGRVLGGADPAEMHAAMRGVREAIARAMARARALLTENKRRPTPELTRRVTGTLRSASLDRRLRAAVLGGRLSEDPAVDEVGALADVRVPKKRPSKPAPQPKKAARRPTPRHAERDAERRAASEARERRAEAKRQERSAAAVRAREARERLRAEVAEAAAAREDARRALSRAEAERRRLQNALADAKRDVARARRSLVSATERHTRAKKRAR